MSWRRHPPDLAIVVLIVLLAVGAYLFGKGGPDGPPRERAAATASPERVALISRRVERLRGLRFRAPVEVAVVSPREAGRVGRAETARVVSAAERRTEEELLKLLSLLPPAASMAEVADAIYEEQVAGFYVPRRRQLALVAGAGVDDITLAHELAHALEDQHFGLDGLGEGADEDRAAAEQSLAEGTATRVMEDYAERWPSETEVGDALAALTQVGESTPLPAYVMRSIIFPYVQGERFVSALRDASGGDWRLVDVALGSRPPQTTAEILDPDRWLRVEQPAAPALRGAPALRAAGFRRLDASTAGAEQLAALLSEDGDPLRARELTAGWVGGRFAFWRRGALPDPDCRAPCRARDAFELAVRMRTPRQAGELASALRAWTAGLPAGSAGAVALDESARTVRAALAPSPGLARGLID